MIGQLATLWRAYLGWVRRLPQATGLLFAARSSWGRSFKVFLFAVGVVLPLGSLIWVVLFWHGNGVLRQGGGGPPERPALVRQATPPLD